MISFTNKFPLVHQLDSQDCGLACISMVAKFYNKNLSINYLKNRFSVYKNGLSISNLSALANELDFVSSPAEISIQKLIEYDNYLFPIILFWRKNHYVVLYKIRKNKYYIADPNLGKRVFNYEQLCQNWITDNNSNSGIVLFIYPNADSQSSKIENNVNTNYYNYSFLKHLISSLSQYKILIGFIAITFILGSFYQYMIPLFNKILFDKGINSKSEKLIFLIIASQFLANIGNISIQFLRSWLTAYTGNLLSIDLMKLFINKLLSLKMYYFDSKMIGDYLQRVEDHNRIDVFLNTKLLNGAFSILTIIIFSIIMLHINTNIFISFIICSSLELFFIFYFMSRQQQIDNMLFSTQATERSAFIELIYGVNDIKINGLSNLKTKTFLDLKMNSFKLNLSKTKVDQLQLGISGFIIFLQISIILVISSLLVINNNMTLGEMLTVSFIIGSVQGSIGYVIDLFANYSTTKNSIHRISDIYNSKSEKNDYLSVTSKNFKNIIFKNVTFKYSDREVLNNINIVIPNNKITAIVGESGSGKTTLAKLILKLYEPSEGQITIDKNEFNLIGVDQWRSQVGAVLQDSYIFSDTIENNITMAIKHDDNRLIQAIKLACIDEFINSLPLQLNTKIGDDGIPLSQGQKQRILIARTIYRNPNVIIFDEATNALDSLNESNVINNLNNFFYNKTIIMIAHRLSTIRNAHQIIVLEKGRVVESGNHDNLIMNKKSYYNLIKNQL